MFFKCKIHIRFWKLGTKQCIRAHQQCFNILTFMKMIIVWIVGDKSNIIVKSLLSLSFYFLKTFLLENLILPLDSYYISTGQHCSGLSHSAMPKICNPVDCSPPGSSVHGDSLGKNTGVGFHSLLQRIFPTQG